MKRIPVLTLVVLGSLLCACSPNSFLGRADQACTKYPLSSERAACEQKEKETSAAFEKYQQQAKTKEKQADAPDEARVPNNTLCFKRQSTGETVCPN